MALFYWGENSPNAPKNKNKGRSDSGDGIWTNRERWAMAIHEAGHYVIGKKLGGWGAYSYIKPGRGGSTEINMPNPRADAIMAAAENMEFGTSNRPWKGDWDEVTSSCRRANKKGDPITPEEAMEIASQMCRRYRGEILRVAERIYSKGHS